jgi:hypothetical protein
MEQINTRKTGKKKGTPGELERKSIADFFKDLVNKK